MVGIALLVFARSELMPRIADVQRATFPTGKGGMLGNKGAVAVRLVCCDTTLCFVSAHLAANKYAYVVAARDQQPDHDPADITSNCTETVVAVFLLAVEEGAFLGCNGCM